MMPTKRIFDIFKVQKVSGAQKSNSWSYPRIHAFDHEDDMAKIVYTAKSAKRIDHARCASAGGTLGQAGKDGWLRNDHIFSV